MCDTEAGPGYGSFGFGKTIACSKKLPEGTASQEDHYEASEKVKVKLMLENEHIRVEFAN